MNSILIVTLLSAFVCSRAAAFAFDSYRKNGAPARRSTRAPFDDDDKPEPNFHVVAQRIGKTVLRPGGSEATKLAQEMANVGPGDTVLELSAGLGRSGIELAQRYGAKVTLTDLDTSRLEKASDLVRRLGLTGQIECRRLDMFDIAGGLGKDAHFDVAQTEASLTHYPRSRKAKFFEDVARHADKFILHEVCFRTDDDLAKERTRREMGRVLNIGFVPETEEGWLTLMSDAGFCEVDFVATGDIAILNPASVMRDEGALGFANIVFNVMTQPYLRRRMLAVRRTISEHSGDLGYITVVASKKK